MAKSEKQLFKETLEEARNFDFSNKAAMAATQAEHKARLENEFKEIMGRAIDPNLHEQTYSHLPLTEADLPIPKYVYKDPVQPSERTSGGFSSSTGFGTGQGFGYNKSDTLNQLGYKKQLELANNIVNKERTSNFDNAATATVSDESIENPLGKLANLGSALKSTTGEVARTVLSAPIRQARVKAEQGISPEQRALYESAIRKKQTTDVLNNQLFELFKTPESPERNARINEFRSKLIQQRLTPEEESVFSPDSAISEDIYETRTIAERLEQSKKLSAFIDTVDAQSKESAAKINTKDVDIATDKLRVKTDQAAKSFDKGNYIEGVSIFLGGVVDLAKEDTYAATQIAVSSIPHMIAMVSAAPAFLPSVAIKLNDEAIESFKEEYGEMPDSEERALIGLISVTSAGLDKASAGAVKSAGTLTKAAIDSSKVLNKKLPSALIKGITVAGAPVGAFVVEGGTEGLQNVLGQVAGKIRDPEIDVSEALIDTAFGGISGVGFASPNIAREATASTTKAASIAAKPVIAKAKEVGIKAGTKLSETSAKLKQTAIKNTDELIQEKSDSDPKEVVERIISDGLDGLTPDQRVERLTTLIKTNAKLKGTIVEDGIEKETATEYEDKVNGLIQAHKNLEIEESTGKTVQEHVKTISDTESDNVTKTESITAVASAIDKGQDLPLKTLETISGSTLFTDLPTETKSTVEDAVKLKKTLKQVSNDIKEGDTNKKGVTNYINDVHQAISLNDQELGNTSIAGLTKWKEFQTSKLALYQKALKESEASGGKRVEFKLEGQTRYAEAKTSNKLIQTIAKDLGLIESTLSQATEMLSKAFDSAPIVDIPVTAEIAPETVQEPTSVPEAVEVKDTAVEPSPVKAKSKPTVKSTKTQEPSISEAQPKSTKVSESVVDSKTIKPTTKKVDSKGSFSKSLSQNLVTNTKSNSNLNVNKSSLPDVDIKGTKVDQDKVFKTSSIEKKGFFNTAHNFFSRYKDNAGEFTTALTKKLGELTSEDKVILNSIVKFNDSVLPKLESNISFLNTTKPIFPEYFSKKLNKQVFSTMDRNPIGYLVKQDSEGNRFLNENVTSLMSTVLYNWLGTRASKTLKNTDEDINRILGRDTDTFVTPAERSLFKYAGTSRTNLAESLGRQVTKQLGLIPGEDVDGNMVDRLATAIGLTMLQAATDLGITEETVIKREDMAVLKAGDTSTDISGKRNTLFIRLVPKKGTVDQEKDSVTKIKSRVSSNPELLDKLFGIESFQIYPRSKPKQTAPETLQGSTQKVPTKMEEATIAKQQVKWEIKPDHNNIVTRINRDLLDRLAGVKDPESVHINKRDKVDSQNTDIKRTVDNYFESIDYLSKRKNSLEDPIYFTYSILNNMRSRMEGTLLNPAANKIARHLVGAESWNVTVPDSKDPTSESIRTNFKLAVVQAFDFSIDKKKPEEGIARFDELMNNPIIQKGIEAVNEINLKGNVTPKYEKALEAAVELGKLNLHSLDGLIAMAQYSPTESFSTNLGMEVDGVTNGLAIGLMQAPIEKGVRKLFEAVGIYFGRKDSVSYPEWASNPLNQDLYKRLTSSWIQELNSLKISDPSSSEDLLAIRDLIGSFSIQQELNNQKVSIINSLGRNMSKDPMMYTGYGASADTATKELSSKFIEEIWDKLADPNEDAKVIVEKVYKLAELPVPKNIDYSKPLDIEFGYNVVNNITDKIKDTYGVALKKALKTSFKEFFEFRNVINGMSNAMYAAFEVKYQKAIADKRESNKGRMLTREEEAEVYESVAKFAPTFKSALSKNREDGLAISVPTKSRDYLEPKAVVQIELDQKVKGGKRSTSAVVSHTTYESPKAKALVFSTHSQDASIQAVSSFDYDYLDIYDAKMLAITDVDTATKQTNQAMWDITTQYSVIDSVSEAFKEVMVGIRGDKDAIQAVLKEINKYKKDPKNHITVNEFNKNVIAMKRKVTSARKGIAQIRDLSVNQYAHTTGVYTANSTETINERTIDKFIEELIQESNQSGSSIDPIDFDNFVGLYNQTLSSDNSLDIFNDMASLGNKVESVEHSNHLKEILTNVVNKVLRATDEIDFKVAETAKFTHGAAKGTQVYLNASTATRLNNNNEMSLQEVQVHELVHTTLNHAIDNNFHIKRELIKLFKTVKKGIEENYGNEGWKIFMHKDINGNDLINNSIAEEEIAAKARYDYIFNNSKVQDIPIVDPLTGKLTPKPTNAYLKEFVAFGLTNESFIKVLENIDSKKRTDITGLPLKDRLMVWFNSALDWISGRLFNTNNLKSDQALRNLVDQLAGVTSKQRNRAIQTLMLIPELNTKAAQKLREWIVQPLIDWRMDQAKRPETVIGKVTGAISLIPITYHNSEFRKHLREVLRRIGVTEERFAVKLVREIQGIKDNNAVWHTLLRQSKHVVDSARKAVAVRMQSYLRESFQDSLPNLDESRAITRVMYKGDMSVLMDKYSIPNLIGLLKNVSQVDAEISKTIQELTQFGTNANYYISQAKGLGNWIATGKGQNKMQSLNAHNIVNLLADVRTNKAKIIGDVVVAEEIVDRLATLYALKAMPTANKLLVAKVMDREHKANNQDNGILAILNVQKNFKAESLNTLFNGNKIQTVKGYTHETFNPRTDIKIGTLLDEAQMAENGYVREDVLKPDPKDPNKTPRVLYVLKDAVNQVYLKGTVSLTSKSARGTSLLDGHVSVGSLSPKQEAARDRDIYIDKAQIDITKQFNNTSVSSTDSALIPIFDDKGNISDFRYTMSEDQKIRLLERDDRFDEVMGSMYGNMKDKLNSRQVNRKVVELAYEDYQMGFGSDPNAYVEIKLNSPEKRYKELYALLPNDMRQDIKEVWGDQDIHIRRELADLIFGYKKWSISEVGKDSDNRIANKFHKVLNTATARHIEAVWQEVVSVAKTNIVIRNPAVLTGNFISNAILSLVKGVPLTYMIKNQALAIRALNDYQKEIKKRDLLQIRLDTTPNLTPKQKKDLEVRIAQLSDNVTTNPLSKLIDEGVFQAITEDLDDAKSPYNFRDKLLSDYKLDRLVDSEHTLVREGIRQSFMTEETSIFKLLMKATQYSDFIARFALHSHNTEVKKMSESDSLKDVIETFVNYDVPTSRQLQYMNDMGFFMFSKFLFRIQKVIFNLLKDHPVSVAISLLTQQVLVDAPDILDTAGLNLDGRVGFVLGPLDTATDVSGLKNLGELVGY